MQPTYLPWMGYFALMNAVDIFVLLDNVQFVRSSWDSRNRIKSTDSKPVLLTVPIRKNKGNSFPQLRHAIIDDTKPWRRKHRMTIEQCYAKSPYIYDVMSFYKDIIEDKSLKILSRINEELIKSISSVLGVCSTIVLASQLGSLSSNRIQRLVDICKAVGATTYVSPAGAVGYLREGMALEIFRDNGMNIKIQEYCHPVYDQINGPFLSHLSIIDPISNIGPKETMNLLAQGHHEISAESVLSNHAGKQDEDNI